MSGARTSVSGTFSVPHPVSHDQLHGVLDQIVQDRQAIPHTIGAAWKVDDQCLSPHTGEPARECGAREIRKGAHSERLGDPACFLVEDGAGGLWRDVEVGEASSAGSEYKIGPIAVGPLAQNGGGATGLIRNQARSARECSRIPWPSSRSDRRSHRPARRGCRRRRS